MARYDDYVLHIHIATDAASTYAELTRPGDPPVRRYLADKAIPSLVKEFGWHYNSDHSLSLNIHQDVDSFLFVDTKKSVNFDLLNSIRSDQYAEASAASIAQLWKASKKQRADILHTYEVAQATYAALQYWDVAEEGRVKDRCVYLARNLEALDIPEMPRVRIVPKVSILPLPPPMPRLRFIKQLPLFTKELPAIEKSMQEYKDLASGICPTCKRKLTDSHIC